jgi:hypothetical protein
MASKVVGVPILGISGLLTWECQNKMTLENTVRGKVVASPKSGLWWVLWVCVCPWLIRAPKMFKLCINQFVIWFVWIIDPLLIRPSPHLGAPACPFTFEVLQIKDHTPTSYPSVVFTFGLTIGSIKEFGGVLGGVLN